MTMKKQSNEIEKIKSRNLMVCFCRSTIILNRAVAVSFEVLNIC